MFKSMEVHDHEKHSNSGKQIEEIGSIATIEGMLKSLDLARACQ